MPRPSWLPLAALVLACARPADRPARDTTAAIQPPAGLAPRAIVTVLYRHPTDHGAFEQYYRATHLPLVGARQAEIGHVRTDLVRFDAAPDGTPPELYREAELYFPDLEALRRGIATEGFQAAGGDLPRFASGGFAVLIGEETSPPAEPAAGPEAVFTVLYREPADPAAFERYYAVTHIPLVQRHAAAIGFTRAELTRFVSNLDGSKRSYYRQAQLYFASPEALRRGIATPEFQTVASDLANFATGGFIIMIGHETR